jgi:hypothetical protein
VADFNTIIPTHGAVIGMTAHGGPEISEDMVAGLQPRDILSDGPIASNASQLVTGLQDDLDIRA